jgi:hypothetical protein
VEGFVLHHRPWKLLLVSTGKISNRELGHGMHVRSFVAWSHLLSLRKAANASVHRRGAAGL